MWTNLVNKGRDLRLMVDATRNDTEVWVTDELDSHKITPHISRAGWLI